VCKSARATSAKMLVRKKKRKKGSMSHLLNDRMQPPPGIEVYFLRDRAGSAMLTRATYRCLDFKAFLREFKTSRFGFECPFLIARIDRSVTPAIRANSREGIFFSASSKVGVALIRGDQLEMLRINTLRQSELPIALR
jgi:hypothetical protein